MHEGLGHQVAAGVVEHLKSIGVFGHNEADFSFVNDIIHVEKLSVLTEGQSLVFLFWIDQFRGFEAIDRFLNVEFFFRINDFHFDLLFIKKSLQKTFCKDARDNAVPPYFRKSQTRLPTLGIL